MDELLHDYSGNCPLNKQAISEWFNMWASWFVQGLSCHKRTLWKSGNFGDIDSFERRFWMRLFQICFSFARHDGLDTCFSLCGNLLAGLRSLDCPDVDSVEDPRLQAGHGVGGGVGPHWDLPTGTLWGAVAYDVTIYVGLGRIPWDSEAGLSYISSWGVSRSVQFWKGGVSRRYLLAWYTKSMGQVKFSYTGPSIIL